MQIASMGHLHDGTRFAASTYAREHACDSKRMEYAALPAQRQSACFRLHSHSPWHSAHCGERGACTVILSCGAQATALMTAPLWATVATRCLLSIPRILLQLWT